MLEMLLVAIAVLLLIIVSLLLSILNMWKKEFTYQNSGLLACLPEINEGIGKLVGEAHLSPAGEDNGQIHELFQKLDAIEGWLQEIDVTTAPLRHAEFPGMRRSKGQSDHP